MTATPENGNGQTDTEDGRGRLIRAALHLFATRGYEGASIANIADEAGVSKGLARFHFGSKRDLYEAVGRHLEEKWGGGREENFASLANQSSEERFLARYRFFRQLPDDTSFLHRSLMEDAEPLPTITKNYEVLRAFLQAEQEKGGRKSKVPADLAALVWMSTELGLMFFLPKLTEAFGIDIDDEENLRKLCAAYLAMFDTVSGPKGPDGEDQNPSDL